MSRGFSGHGVYEISVLYVSWFTTKAHILIQSSTLVYNVIVRGSNSSIVFRIIVKFFVSLHDIL